MIIMLLKGKKKQRRKLVGLIGINKGSLSKSHIMLPSSPLVLQYIDQNNKRIVLALQSGLKSELIWALNTLTLLSFKEKDDVRRDAVPLAKIPGLLDALLQVVRVLSLTIFIIDLLFTTSLLWSNELQCSF